MEQKKSVGQHEWGKKKEQGKIGRVNSGFPLKLLAINYLKFWHNDQKKMLYLILTKPGDFRDAKICYKKCKE